MDSTSAIGARRAFAAAALLGVQAATAATIYGALSEGGQPVAGATLELNCGADGPAAARTDARGAYRFTVSRTGKCELRAAGGAAPVIVYNEPTRYDFEVRRAGGGTTLVRR